LMDFLRVPTLVGFACMLAAIGRAALSGETA
jgi:hypothetical protein